MIAVDSSALMAIVMAEPEGRACMDALDREPRTVIAAATLAETLIVAARRRASPRMDYLIEGLKLTVIPVDEAFARRAAAAYQRWGKNFDRAALNFGDCFSYVVAQDHACPLLYIGDDFARTDVVSAL